MSDHVEDDILSEGFEAAFASLGRAISLAETLDAKRVAWRNGLREALTTWHGIDRTTIIDQCYLLAEAKGLVDHFSVDEIQKDISEEVERAKAKREQPPQNGNGQYQSGNPGAQTIPITSVFPIDEKTIPPRDWVIPGFLMRRHITVLVAPSGSGKSLLTLQIGLACTVGQVWANWRPRGKPSVLVVNSEDDTTEMTRRLAAAVRVMQLQNFQNEISTKFLIADDPTGVVLAKFDARTKTLVRTPHLEALVNTILSNRIDVVFVDPFAETFEGDENSNSELKWAGVLWREVARRTNTAICLVHHTKKYASGMAGDVDAARGASALIGIARLVATLFPMTAAEAEAMEISENDKPAFLRYDDAKANLNLKSPFARWFKKQTIILDNATETLPPDEVGALEMWTPKGPLDGITQPDIDRFFQRLDQGLLDAQGAPVGEFYVFSSRKASEHEMSRYIGNLAMDVFRCELSKATQLIKIWRDNKRFREHPYYSRRQRKERVGVFSETGKPPNDGLPL
jgi:hypothetical protein